MNIKNVRHFMVGSFNSIKVSWIKMNYVAKVKKDEKTKHKDVVKSESNKKQNGCECFGITLTTKKIQIKLNELL